MRGLALILLAVLWAAPALAETKDGPGGFGPIKFGMTKAEAWAAIDGKGEWNEAGNVLSYEMEIPESAPLFGRSLKVRHVFSKRFADRAGSFGVAYKSIATPIKSCYREISYFLGKIHGKYGVEPITLNEPPKLGFLEDSFYYSIFVFEVKNHSTITVEAEISNESAAESAGAIPWCHVRLLYEPPPSEELPF